MITTLDLAQKTGVGVKTLTRWANRGIIPKPAVGTHPNGRGKIGYWPDSVLERCRRLAKFRKQGHDLETAVIMAQMEDLNLRMDALKSPTMADILSRKKVRLKNGCDVDLLQVFLGAVASDIKKSPVDRDYHAKILEQIKKADLLRQAVNMIQGGFNPVITFDGSETRVEADFVISHLNGVRAFVTVPIRPAFCRFMEAIGAKELLREPTISPAPKVWCRDGDVMTEYAIFLGGVLGFELLRQTAIVIGRTPSGAKDGTD